MKQDATSVATYIEALSEERREIIERLRQVIKDHLPEGFEEVYQYDMITYVVPFSRYPAGYHVTPTDPLPFLSLASQKNHIALYHMGIYANPTVYDWFVEAYAQRVPRKLDMGKSCIRFKNMKMIPYELIGELCEKISVEEHIKAYEDSREK